MYFPKADTLIVDTLCQGEGWLWRRADGTDSLIYEDATLVFSHTSVQLALQVRHGGEPLRPQQHAAVLSLGLPGLNFQADRRRVYPNGALVSQVIGYVGVDNEGLAGVEKSLEADLLQEDNPTPVALTWPVQIGLWGSINRRQRHD